MAYAQSVAGIGCGMHVEVICTTAALWPNPLVHRRHSTKRCAARRKPDTSARPWRAIQSTPTQSWRANAIERTQSCRAIYTSIVPSRDSPHANARQQPASASLPAYARSLVVALLSVGVGVVGQARSGTWQYARLHLLLTYCWRHCTAAD